MSTVLPNFVSGIAAEPCPAFDERRGVVFIGSLSSQKGIQDVMALAKTEPEWQITIAGSGQLAADVKKLAAALPNLSFAGFVQPKQATELLRSARILLLPSRWQEPGSIAALEAMAVGTPVVAFRNGGLAEYVDGAAAGRVVEPGVDTMRKACAELLGSRLSWQACSTAGRRAARETHSVNRYLDRIEAIYRGVCAAPS